MTEQVKRNPKLASAALIVSVFFVSLCAARCAAAFVMPCHGEAAAGPCATLSSQNWLPAPDSLVLAAFALIFAAALFALVPTLGALPAPVRPIRASSARAGPSSRRFSSISPRAP